MPRNITEFTAQMAKQGLSRANRWVVRVFPPRGLTATGNVLNNTINKGGNKLDINIPFLDAADAVSFALEDLELDLGGVSIGHNFKVPTLGYALTNMGGKLEALNLFATSCTLPGRSIEAIAHDVYGETRQMGVKHQHEGISVQYYCSEDLREKLFFEQWQDLIFNPNNKNRSYYDEYTAEIEVLKYDNNWKHQSTYRFYEAWPVGLSELQLGNEAETLQLAINFAYRYYEKVK